MSLFLEKPFTKVRGFLFLVIDILISYEFNGLSPNEYLKKGLFFGAVSLLISQCGWKGKIVGHIGSLVPDLGKPQTTHIIASDFTRRNYQIIKKTV